ncbi:MAG: YciI family protein [Conexivisphaerales archaeon]
MIVCQFVSFMEQPTEELMKKHRAFLREKGKKGELMLAGRFYDKTGSLMVWRANSVEEARRIASEDPYYVNGITTFILKRWNLTWDFTENPPVQPDE